jgi:protein O-GlcNAc transferase
MTIPEQLQAADAHQRAGRYPEAEKIYREILAKHPSHLPTLHALAALGLRGGHPAASAELLRRLLRVYPNDRVAHNNLGIALQTLGDLNEAVACYHRALAIDPNNVEALGNLGNAFLDLGKYTDALASLREAVRLKPDNAVSHYNLATAERKIGRYDESIASYQRAVALQPDFAKAWNNLGSTLEEVGRLDEAVAALNEALRLRVDYAMGYSNLGNAFQSMGRIEESITARRKALAIDPTLLKAHSNLILSLFFHHGDDHHEIQQELGRWNQTYFQPLRKLIQPHKNDRDPNRRLRIGYLSPDFREHSVSRFLLPLLRNHDHESFEIFCYSDVSNIDKTTNTLRACADAWHDVSALSDDRIVSRIREDRIDILVDLAGHTADNRLRVFAIKPAPVQVTWLGYPGSTGLPEIDYRITDPLADPSGKTESLHTEKLFRLPISNWCIDEPPNAPPIGDLPATAGGAICFGSFNYFAKVSPKTLDLWAKILAAVPSSRLLVKSRGLQSESIRRKVLETLSTHAIPLDRLEIRGHEPTTSSHLELYNRVDIALDTYPYHGTTTTCEALWMGVPVITLAGPTHVSRVGVSLLTNVGLPELIAQSPDEYISLATSLARDIPRLANLRRTMRDRMRASPLMDAPRFARDVEAAYRQMWQTWCMAGSNSPL